MREARRRLSSSLSRSAYFGARHIRQIWRCVRSRRLGEQREWCRGWWPQANPGFLSDRQREREIDSGPFARYLKARCEQMPAMPNSQYQTQAAPKKHLNTSGGDVERCPRRAVLCCSKRYQDPRCPSFRGWPGYLVIGWLPVRQQGFGLTGLSESTQGLGPVTSLRLGGVCRPVSAAPGS
jgi:hypothetical protein